MCSAGAAGGLVEQGVLVGSKEEAEKALYGSDSEGDDVRLIARDVVWFSDEQEAWLWGLAVAAAEEAWAVGRGLCAVGM